MKYKIYRLTDSTLFDIGTLKSVIEDQEFRYEEFNTINEAVNSIKARGDDYVEYTILPIITLS
jgi:hypothetical protein